MIEIKGLWKIYKTGEIKVVALKNVDIQINKGEFVAIMGPSGSGKSTLMNILGCLDKATKGKYVLDNTAVDKLVDDQLAYIRNKKIGFVFQSFNLLARTSALKNVELPMVYAKSKNRKILALEALRRVGLEDRTCHKPNELSGGQKQRVAIARALVNNPAIILADEPTGNLDSKSSEEIMQIFKTLNKERSTIIVVTHEQHIAEQAKRIITFKDGEIVSDVSKSVLGDSI